MDRGRGFGYRGRGRGRGNFGGRGGQRGGWRGRGGGDPQDRNGQASGNSERRRDRVIRPIGYRRLQELCEKDPKEVVLTLVERTSGCKELLDETSIRKDLVALLLRVLARACDCSSSPENTMKLLVMVRYSKFLTGALAMYFAVMPAESSYHAQQEFQEPIKCALRLFRELLDRSASSHIEVGVPLAVLGTTINTLRAVSTVVDDDIEIGLAEVESRRDAIIEATHRGAVLRDDDGTLATRLDRQLQLETPPDDFRELSVIPTFEDIHTDKEPFLRPNIVRGRYPDVDTYLDVQFRLLREDFVRPLREGISEFLDMRRRGLGHDRRLQDIRVYHDVHVVHPICTNSGIVYRIQFDAARLRGVRWRSTKRLIFGSLLCLSKDEFKTMFFVTVANRDPKQLEQGSVEVRFEQNLEAASAISPTETFIMVETSAYFEAYRHVLKGLQEVRQNTMPFTKYIVDCDCANGVNPPAYLRGRFGADEEVVDVYDDNNPHFGRSRAVPILREDRWPSADALHLDDSQYQAVKMALTKEFSVIQGPPGTGKTYIGLKIVQALLKNKSVWLRNQDLQNSPTRPILVVCYTNHALDQFLEGISEFHPTGIVRVGGRSRSEKMEQFQLKTIRFSKRKDRKVPRYIHEGGAEARNDMQRYQQQMEMAVAQMMATQRGLIHEDALMPFMEENHKDTLMNMWLVANDDAFGWSGAEQKGSVMVQWLCLTGTVFILPTEDGQNQPEEGDEEEEAVEQEDEEIDVMEEADLLEEQRLLDDDELPYGHSKRGRAKKNVVAVDLALDVEALQLQEHQAGNQGEWQVQTNAKKKKQRVKHELSKTDMMTDTEVRHVQNVWTLQPRDRWRLYRHWVAKYCAKYKDSIKDYEREYERAAKRLTEFQSQEDGEIMKEATVIGMTTTGAAKHQSLLQDIKPSIIVVEEAAEVLEAHIVTTLSQQCQHLILIGDHQQLRPNPTVYQLAKKYNMDISLFERMVKNDMQCQRLQSQHRMRPEFARLLTPHIYESLDNHESVLNFDNIKGVSSNMFFVDHSYWEAHDTDTKSRSNMHEARFMASFCRYLLQQGYRPSQITILTTYTGQLFNFKKVMPRQVFEGVRVCAVDNFQGEENDIILLSLVRSNDEGNVGFLKVENRVCVALSRAKKGFYAIGNLTMLAEASPLWSKIIKELREQHCVGTHLNLCCQNHPDSRIPAATDKDFNKAPEGGCMRPCEFRLKCGHVCTSVCHPTDPEHEEYRCKKPCPRVLCDLGHRCTKLCSQPCGDCKVLVEKTIPRCQHKQKIPCSTSPNVFKCQAPCDKPLPCGHDCKNKCSQECSIPCMEMVPHLLRCGHTIQAACSAKKEDLVCNTPCSQPLKCEHVCAGTCGRCKQGRLHQPCIHPCNRVLVCSHQCTAPCTRNCPPCSKRCENRCIHSRCPHECGKPCVPCQEPCEWRCKHHKCNKPCGEPCDRPRCDRPCQKTRRCRKCKKDQPCIGMCGEPCPDKCPDCDREDLTEIFFGTEDEDDAQFVQLEDCGHVLEVSGLDQWMDSTDKNIKLKTCPKCKTPIRRNLRYGNTIKKTLVMIEKVKKKCYGDDVQKAQTTATANRLMVELQTDADLLTCLQTSEDLLQQMQRHRLFSLDQVAMYENKVLFLKSLAKVKKEKRRDRNLIFGETRHITGMDKEIEEMEAWLHRRTARVGEQEWEEFGREMTRLNFLLKLRILQAIIRKKGISLDGLAQGNLDLAECRLTGGEVFTESTEQLVKQALEKVKRLTPRLAGGADIGISEEERVQVVKAMGLSQGHWFQCPNGHVYAIGDCGGATVESTCPECRARIGGGGHRLRSDNRLAPEMDGARHAAWSDAANMENYLLDFD
ncbi:PREDICTED: NFX1-type zinc finger-containing protein 1-like [Branchiostoma belcheri]|uniref:NFX1-type zinc finger-containing protein 1-like n=1 Tax=Branchiostoma belcheri TaxID=7741 RepID=A0A6P5AA93_BRABE|nr:PREDICTED: NFX1-type zinc finger-containing protein 1-like [Branchiostoma belcheri]